MAKKRGRPKGTSNVIKLIYPTTIQKQLEKQKKRLKSELEKTEKYLAILKKPVKKRRGRRGKKAAKVVA